MLHQDTSLGIALPCCSIHLNMVDMHRCLRTHLAISILRGGEAGWPLTSSYQTHMPRAQVESLLRGEGGLASVRSSRLYLVDLAGAQCDALIS